MRFSGAAAAGTLDLVVIFCDGDKRQFLVELLLHDRFSFPAPEPPEWSSWFAGAAIGFLGVCLQFGDGRAGAWSEPRCTVGESSAFGVGLAVMGCAGTHPSPPPPPPGRCAFLAEEKMMASWYIPCRKLTTCSSSRTTSSSNTATSARRASVCAAQFSSESNCSKQKFELRNAYAECGTDLRRQIGGQARQRAERPREGPLQSSVDVLLMPQLLLQLVHLAELPTSQRHKRNAHRHRSPWIQRKSRQNSRTSCCSASFRSLLDWILFAMPLAAALAVGPFAGMAFLWSFCII